MGMQVKTVGRRRQRSITFHASPALLEDGARFNDEIHRLPTGNRAGFPKGIYRYRTPEEANRHQDAFVVEALARTAIGQE